MQEVLDQIDAVKAENAALQAELGATVAPVLFEVCIDSVESGLAAEAGGGGRVELCDNLVDGGTTPSIGTVRVCRRNLKIPVNVIIRPRGGDFLYSELEMETMIADIEAMKAAGVNGVVIGVLLADGSIDRINTQKLVDCARPMSITFHRAFDVVPDPDAALDVCMELGIDRILTSGLQASAAEDLAKSTLKRLVDKSAGRCQIMAGAGITADNVADIIQETGVREVHASAGRITLASAMKYRPPQQIFMGAEKLNTQNTEFIAKFVSEDRVRAYVDVMSGL
jgi:copper homeostasis protein